MIITAPPLTIGSMNPRDAATGAPAAAPGGLAGFGGMLSSALDESRKATEAAEAAGQALALGKDTDIHSTMIAMEKADISFQFIMQIRNKIISAYETVMRTQV